jgi:endoglucanase
MKRLLSILSVLAVAMTAVCSCDDPIEPDPDGPKAPEAIELSADELVFTTADAGNLPLTVTAPARPAVEVPSDAKGWLSIGDGVFKDYKITFTVKAAANDTYSERSAVLTVSSSGVPSVTVKVSQAAKEKPVDPDPPTPSGADGLASFFGLGWNMGNHFDAYYNGSWAGDKEGYPDEEVWGATKATQTTFDGVKGFGFTSVRIPVSWLNMIGPEPDYKIDETWMNRVYEVVQFAHNSGLKVIINTHHDENHGVNNTYQWLDIKNAANNSALNESIKAKIEAVWTQIARKFADCGDWLIMESFNELNDGQWGWSEDFRKNPTRQCNILNEWNQVFVDAVRATGGNNATRWLGVPTYAANPEFEKYWTLPSDPVGKTMLAVHFYDPSDYTIGEAQYSDWGHTGAAGRKASGGDEDHVQAVFGNLYNKYVSRGVPVYLGEFGCSMRAKSDARAWAFYKYYLEYVVKAARTYGLPC